MSCEQSCSNSEIEKKEIPMPECGYRLGTIYFYLTEGCNLKCRHCWIAPTYEACKDGELNFPYVSLAMVKDIIDQGIELGLGGVKLTGGEPLIHPQIDEVIKYINSKKLRLVIETNGVSVTPELASLIAEGENSFVSVSIDSHERETHEWVRGVPGCYDASLRGIKNLVDAGFKPQIIMSVMRRNVEHIESLVKLAEEVGAGSVKFNLVTPTERGKEMTNKGETLTIEELVELGDWVENDLAKRVKIRLHYSHPLAFRRMSKLFGENDCGGCGIFSIIGVLGSGKYALCGIGESVPEMIFGDAKIDRLANVWNNTSMLNDIREGLPSKLEGVCGDCTMKSICKGSCIANNYYSSKRLFAPYWYCSQAFEAGLFPKSRLIPNSESDLK
jgi:SynChlorMet cassette radical SAM/SPASM protein ScmF